MTQSPNPQSHENQPPVIVRQGGDGTAIGLVIAALILAAGAIWAVTIWSNTQLRLIEAPAEAIKEGVEGAADAITPGS